MNAAGYTRLSQASDTSIDNQKENIAEYAASRGFDLVTIYDDGQGASGFNTNRQEYDELVQAARGGDIGAIVVNDRSRLGRDKWQRIEHFSSLVRHGVEFHTCKDGFIDPDEPTVLLQEAMYAQQHDEGKREEIEKSRAAVGRRIENGCYQGTPPKGLEFGDDKCHLQQSHKWDDLETAFRLFENDDTTLAEISDDTGFTVSTLSRIRSRGRTYYEQRLAEYGVNG